MNYFLQYENIPSWWQWETRHQGDRYIRICLLGISACWLSAAGHRLLELSTNFRKVSQCPELSALLCGCLTRMLGSSPFSHSAAGFVWYGMVAADRNPSFRRFQWGKGPHTLLPGNMKSSRRFVDNSAMRMLCSHAWILPILPFCCGLCSSK